MVPVIPVALDLLKKLPWWLSLVALIYFQHTCLYKPAAENRDKYETQAKERREKLNTANTALIDAEDSLKVLSGEVIRANEAAAKRASMAKKRLAESRTVTRVTDENDPNAWINTLPQ